MMHPLKIDVSAYGTSDEIKTNIRQSIERGLPELGLLPIKHDGTFVIVGSGPSVKNHIQEISREQLKGRPICAIKGAHDFLVENGIIPDLFVTTEPRERNRNIKYKNPKTVYLVASRCHQDTFEHLKGCNVMLWHAWMDNPETDELIAMNKIGIGGGTTSGLRAVNIAYVWGFRNIHFYGMDSCLDETGQKRINEGPMADEVKKIDVHVGGRKFVCNMAMAQQAEDFQSLYDIMPDIHIESFGDGLITAIIEERKRNNFKT